ncbi:MAG: methyltransferase domain-containing protein [Rudaea sp.]
MPDASDFYSSAPMRILLAHELAALAPILSDVYGNYGLILRPGAQLEAGLPAHLLGKTVELALGEKGLLLGAVRCAPWQLPFANESFQLLVAQHVFEHIDDSAACAAEAARVLAPEGTALIFGFNPLGMWRPWLARRARGLRVQSAQAWRMMLAREQIDTLQVRFPGLLWPRASAQPGSRGDAETRLARWGSSWLLIARKRRSMLTPLRLRNAREVVRAPRLAPNAHRNCA